MLRQKPNHNYSGLTIVLSNPSRSDDEKGQLLSAGGGSLVDEFLRPYCEPANCDIRVKEDRSELLEGTKCVLLAGEAAAQTWLQNTDNSIGEIRGSVFKINGIPAISTFFPQDAADIKDYEAKHNELSERYGSEDSDDDDEDSGIGAKRRHGRTARKNYRFWLEQDITKAKCLLRSNGVVPYAPFASEYKITPREEEIIKVLNTEKNKLLFIDLETTWPPPCHIHCIGFSFGYDGPAYVFPLYNFNRQLAYPRAYLLLRALAVAFRDNIVVAHNGAGFDFPILAWNYKIPIRNMQDTMIMMHRWASDVERSLGHLTSLMTWEPFHKDQGSGGYYNHQQQQSMLEYCGKDVYTMKLAHYEMCIRAKRIPGMQRSFDDANKAIYPYLVTMLHGIHYKEDARRAIIKENDRLMMQYIRMLRILIGDHNLKVIAGKSNKAMPGSNVQCVRYFHDMLGYPATMGKERKDGSKGASLGKKNMLKLKLKHMNPVIDIVLAYREASRESGSLKFLPWLKSPEMIEQEKLQEPNGQLKIPEL